MSEEEDIEKLVDPTGAKTVVRPGGYERTILGWRRSWSGFLRDVDSLINSANRISDKTYPTHDQVVGLLRQVRSLVSSKIRELDQRLSQFGRSSPVEMEKELWKKVKEGLEKE